MTTPTLAAELRMMTEGRDPGRSSAPMFPAVLLDAAARLDALEDALTPFGEWLRHPSVPIMAAIRPEEWDKVREVYAKVRP